MNNIKQRILSAKFLDTKPRILLELSNETETTLRSVEILTIFLKRNETEILPRETQIKFDTIKSLPPQATAVIAHRTWIDGKPARDEHDQMAQLQIEDGKFKPYVLDISWEDAAGKSQFQRIPVGH